MSNPRFNQPLGGNAMPRTGGPATMMRLPAAETAAGLDACFIGIPMDIGTSNRPGTRFGPRQIRTESCMIRPYNMATRAAPFESRQVADPASAQSGISADTLKKLLPIVAMLVAGYLARQNAAPGAQAPAAAPQAGGLGGMLGSVLGSVLGGGAAAPAAAPAAPAGGLGGLTSILDLDGDGNPLNDIIGMAGRLRQ